MSKNKVSSAMFFVLLAGLIWSFGPLIIRNINNAELIPWQYSLIRGSAIFLKKAGYTRSFIQQEMLNQVLVGV